MNGDKVKVEITLRKAGGRAEGRVVTVEKRARDTIVGQLRFDGEVFFVAPMDEKLPSKILITDDVSEHKDKIVEVEDHPVSHGNAMAGRQNRVGHRIHRRSECRNECHHQEVRLADGISRGCRSRKSLRLPDALTEKDFIGRDDFQETEHDHDRSADRARFRRCDRRRNPAGRNVFSSAFTLPTFRTSLSPDSAMDIEARCRGTSVYFPDRVIPMLPEKVSNHLCSLNPEDDRLAMSVMMHLSRTGEVLDYSFHKSVIHSKERMTYEDVQKSSRRRSRCSSSVTRMSFRTSGTSHAWPRSFKSAGSSAVRSISILPEPLLTYDERRRGFGHHEIGAALLASHC